MTAALVLVSAIPLMWVLYLAYTALRATWPTLRPEVKAAGAAVVAAGWLLDVALNWTAGLALGITPDATLSQKCGRLKRAEGWRAGVARYLCANWLDPFEFGGHCR
ncbi:MAG: hypothetical protein HYY97_15780 [Rhodocyclales bacterium]|nr:hypothetical protein [Rhodocyclales bacterium]